MNITDNLKLGSTSYGDPNAPKLVVTPGWATDSNFLKPFVSLFPDYNVILLDMPGYGKSEELKQFSISTRQTANLILNSIPTFFLAYNPKSLHFIRFCALKTLHFIDNQAYKLCISFDDTEGRAYAA